MQNLQGTQGTLLGAKWKVAKQYQAGSHLRSHLAVSVQCCTTVSRPDEKETPAAMWRARTSLCWRTACEKVEPSAPGCAACPAGSLTQKSSTLRTLSLQKISLESQDTYWQQQAPLRYLSPCSCIYLRNFMHRKEWVKGNIQIHDRRGLYCYFFFSQRFVFF